MNERIEIILLQIVTELKKLQWNPDPNFRITLKGEGYVPLEKLVSNPSYDVNAYMSLKLGTDDNVTFYPDYKVEATLDISGETADIEEVMDANVAFSERDVRNQEKMMVAAKKINDNVEEFIQTEWDEFERNSEPERKFNASHREYNPEDNMI